MRIAFRPGRLVLVLALALPVGSCDLGLPDPASFVRDGSLALDRGIDRGVDEGAADLSAPTRTAFSWPYASSSPWNTPIGSAATYADDPVLSGFAGSFIVLTAVNVARAAATDPMVTVTWNNDGDGTNLPCTLRVPRGVTGAAPVASNGWLVIIEPDGRTCHEFSRFDRLTDATAKAARNITSAADAATRCADCDIVSGEALGSAAERAGSYISNGSIFAGLIREWELAASGIDSIRHALAFGLDLSQLKKSTSREETFTWPAMGSGSSWATFGGTIPVGTLIALDPGVDVNTLGLSPAGAKIAWTLQRFGGYVTTSSASSSMYLMAEPVSFLPSKADLTAIRPHLRLVTNSAKDSVGGGGTYPPALWPPPTPVP